jgi:nucleotide-binding universal stress UspA family protein
MFTNILIPTDGSKLAEAAAENAVAFARDAKASVVFVCVIEPFHIFTTDREKLTIAKDDYDRLADAQAAKFLNEVEARARHQGVVSHTVKVQSDQVHIAIVDAAIENGAT